MAEWKEPSDWNRLHEKYPDFTIDLIDKQFARLLYKGQSVSFWDKTSFLQGEIVVDTVYRMMCTLKYLGELK